MKGPLKYASFLVALLFGGVALSSTGIWTFSLPIYAFVVVPLLELFLRPDHANMTEQEEAIAKDNVWYDLIVYLTVPLQFAFLFYYLYGIAHHELAAIDIAGRTLSMGIGCGVMGINVGHELGHRATAHERIMAKLLLLTSLYMHFIIEHNRGHHKRVSTPEDPASAQRGEIVYFFWIKSVVGGFLSAWNLEKERLERNGLSFWSINNEMIRMMAIQVAFCGGIYWVFGLPAMLLFLVAALLGILLLETVNYIEHYGLSRKQLGEGRYEKVQPHHSWNSDHLIGRLMLFELSRHSDHHYKASRKYQILRYFENTPQMPTGYPGMIVLALFPPLWFYVMHRELDKQFRFDAGSATAVS